MPETRVAVGAGWDDTLVLGHCGGQDLVLVGAGCTWQGEDEVASQEFRCKCGAEIAVSVRRHVGPPPG